MVRKLLSVLAALLREEVNETETTLGKESCLKLLSRALMSENDVIDVRHALFTVEHILELCNDSEKVHQLMKHARLLDLIVSEDVESALSLFGNSAAHEAVQAAATGGIFRLNRADIDFGRNMPSQRGTN